MKIPKIVDFKPGYHDRRASFCTRDKNAFWASLKDHCCIKIVWKSLFWQNEEVKSDIFAHCVWIPFWLKLAITESQPAEILQNWDVVQLPCLRDVKFALNWVVTRIKSRSALQFNQLCFLLTLLTLAINIIILKCVI